MLYLQKVYPPNMLRVESILLPPPEAYYDASV